ncbi:PAS domain-containing protein [Micromonospora sp. M12]
MINSGDAGLPVLTQLLRVAQPALGATGMAFVEFGPTGGRVIAATGAAEWALGRPLTVDDPDTVCLLSGPRVRQVRVGDLNGKLAGELAGSGLRRMVVSRAEIGGHTVGSLHALYPGDDEPGSEQQGVVAYLASCIAHMYGDQSGLPVHGDGPVVAALADGLAVVDRDGHVRLWNPAAAQVTGRSVEQALSRPLPLRCRPPGRFGTTGCRTGAGCGSPPATCPARARCGWSPSATSPTSSAATTTGSCSSR